MPGKVNPVMAEMLNMVCFQVLGCDTAIAYALQAGQMELNVMMPVMAWNLLLSETILTNALHVFTDRCVAGITADPAQSTYFLDRSVGLATILNPKIGYSAAAEVAKESVAGGKSIRELVLERGLLTNPEMDALIGDTYQTRNSAHRVRTGTLRAGGFGRLNLPRPELTRQSVGQMPGCR
jgi:aspartate ammonia-lyase